LIGLDEGVSQWGEGVGVRVRENHHFQGAGEEVALLGFFMSEAASRRISGRGQFSFKGGLEGKKLVIRGKWTVKIKSFPLG